MGSTEGSSSRRLAVAAVLAVALAGMVLLWAETRHRMGMNADGTLYLGGARGLLAGQGAAYPWGGEHPTPLVHFPPLYSMVLAGAGALAGQDPLEAARWLQPLLLAAMLGLTGWAAFLHTRSAWAALLAPGLVLLTRDVLDGYANFMSEGLFILLGLAALMVLHSAAQRRRLGMVALAGVLVGLCWWTRYAALAFAAAGVAGIALERRRSARDKAFALAAFLLPLALIVAALVWRNRLMSGASINRGIYYVPENWHYLKAMIDVPSCWLLATPNAWQPRWWALAPQLLGLALLAAATAMAAWCGARVWVRQWTSPSPGPGTLPPDAAVTVATEVQAPAAPWPAYHLWFLLAYTGLMVFSVIFVDPPAAPIETRLLIPMAPMLAVVLTWGAVAVVRTCPLRAVALAGVVLAVGSLAASNLVRVRDFLGARNNERYLLFSEPRWLDSSLAQAVRGLPAEGVLYCNGADVLYYLTSRTSRWVPKRHVARQPGYLAALAPEFVAEARLLGRTLQARGGYIVMFRQHWYQDYGGCGIQDLARVLPLEVVVAVADGAIYRLAPAADRPATPASVGGLP